MLSRRQFLRASTTTAGAMVTLLLIPGCSDDDEPQPRPSTDQTTPPPGPGNGTPPPGEETPPPEGNPFDPFPGDLCEGIPSVSSLELNHVHELCVPAEDLRTPPPNGQTYGTSFDDGHLHNVTFTAADLMAIAAGQSVTKTTTVDNGHTHTFTILRA